jgi:hypothetical protein
VGAENRGVPRQVVEVVHDYRHKQIQHQEAGTKHQFLRVIDRQPSRFIIIVSKDDNIHQGSYLAGSGGCVICPVGGVWLGQTLPQLSSLLQQSTVNFKFPPPPPPEFRPGGPQGRVGGVKR